MARTKQSSRMGPDIPEISSALDPYRQMHPAAQVRSYRQNSASIRVRVIDPDFQGMEKGERHDRIWTFLESMPDDLLSQVSVVLLLTPEEVDHSFTNMDFEDPIFSRL